ncbi:MAG: bifunctional 3,4-dihydroxy-2-butanone-4-phosphate synthase/GTP cyclohydrolase II [Ignavibacteria bacterium]|jgi:3,4-dihydroxy 2-butanone 4-phosphate synthase/GTP cyclohydrolase II|nr:bifunctional 3,4-dihydroxy-2-butanone-4-phosphate synthase/GTP cyclohydrolase II [Ignavibacteria bacterium]
MNNIDNYKLNTIDEAIEDLASGKLVVVMDDEDRENEGDLIGSAELCTPEMVNFMSMYGRGLICAPIAAEIGERLNINMMVEHNTALHSTGFTVSVDYLKGTTTGISALDRAKTVRALADGTTKPEDLGRPGHIFPLLAVPEGVLRRAGHTEAVVDLMKIAGLKPAGILCEIINDDGTMSRKADLIPFSQKHNLKIITVKALIAYRLQQEQLVQCVAKANLPTEHGNFTILGFQNSVDKLEHIALVKGDLDANMQIIQKDKPILVRVHSECLTGDVFTSMRCDCGDQLHKAMEQIDKEGLGVIVYMRQEGRGIGLLNKVKAYQLQDGGLDTVEANVKLGFEPDPRNYGIGAQILRSLGVTKMRLMTNNPQKRVGLESYGLEVSELVSIELPPNEHNHFYLETKKNKMGHKLEKV